MASVNVTLDDNYNIHLLSDAQISNIAQEVIQTPIEEESGKTVLDKVEELCVEEYNLKEATREAKYATQEGQGKPADAPENWSTTGRWAAYYAAEEARDASADEILGQKVSAALGNQTDAASDAAGASIWAKANKTLENINAKSMVQEGTADSAPSTEGNTTRWGDYKKAEQNRDSSYETAEEERNSRAEQVIRQWNESATDVNTVKAQMDALKNQVDFAAQSMGLGIWAPQSTHTGLPLRVIERQINSETVGYDIYQDGKLAQTIDKVNDENWEDKITVDNTVKIMYIKNEPHINDPIFFLKDNQIIGSYPSGYASQVKSEGGQFKIMYNSVKETLKIFSATTVYWIRSIVNQSNALERIEGLKEDIYRKEDWKNPNSAYVDYNDYRSLVERVELLENKLKVTQHKKDALFSFDCHNYAPSLTWVRYVYSITTPLKSGYAISCKIPYTSIYPGIAGDGNSYDKYYAHINSHNPNPNYILGNNGKESVAGGSRGSIAPHPDMCTSAPWPESNNNTFIAKEYSSKNYVVGWNDSKKLVYNKDYWTPIAISQVYPTNNESYGTYSSGMTYQLPIRWRLMNDGIEISLRNTYPKQWVGDLWVDVIFARTKPLPKSDVLYPKFYESYDSNWDMYLDGSKNISGEVPVLNGGNLVIGSDGFYETTSYNGQPNQSYFNPFRNYYTEAQNTL